MGRTGKHKFGKIGNGGINWDCPVSLQQAVFCKLEKICLMDLASTMQKKIMGQKKPLFQVWMNEDQDKVQIAAEAYSMRVVYDACLGSLERECRDTASLVNKCLLLSMYYDA